MLEDQNNLQLIVTKDGSHSIFNALLNETYHSVGGAIEESEYIYVNKGLRALEQKNIKILEIGFGTGLNTILSLKEAIDKEILIDYTTLEPFPLPEEIIQQLNYPALLNDSYLEEKFRLFHSISWDKASQIIDEFLFTKHKIKIEDFETPEVFDLVYYDAFAPSKQAEIWNILNLKKVKGMLRPGGILVTYCSNGKFKRNLKEVGFEVESLPGPLGKREITRAWG